MRRFWLLLPSLLLGCDALEVSLPALSLEKRDVATEPAAESVPDEARARQDRQALVKRLGAVAQRFVAPPLPAALADCSRGLSGLGPGTSLATFFVDARSQTKGLIPRRVTERLESKGMSDWRHAAELLEGRSAEEIKALELLAEDWQQQRYLGVFYLTDYAGPALVLRIGELKRSWIAGRLGATLGILDTEQGRLLCGVTVLAQNDTKDAPIRSRLQAETRSRLERDLATRLLAGAEALLQRAGGRATLELAASVGEGATL